MATFLVTKTLVQTVTVEADSTQEAEQLAERGDWQTVEFEVEASPADAAAEAIVEAEVAAYVRGAK